MIIVSKLQVNFTQNLKINLLLTGKLHEIKFFIDYIFYFQMLNGYS